MSLLWDPWQGLGPGPLSDRAFLAQAHVQCLGGSRDELIVEEVTRLLRSVRQRARAPGQALQQLVDAEAALAASGRHYLGDADVDQAVAVLDCLGKGSSSIRALRAAHLEDSVPRGLPPGLSEALRVATGRDGQLRALPAHILELHSRQKKHAVSSTRERLQTWLEGPDGKAWQEERKRLFRADDAGDDEEEAGGALLAP